MSKPSVKMTYLPVGPPPLVRPTGRAGQLLLTLLVVGVGGWLMCQLFDASLRGDLTPADVRGIVAAYDKYNPRCDNWNVMRASDAIRNKTWLGYEPTCAAPAESPAPSSS